LILHPVNEHRTNGPRQRIKEFQPVQLFATVLDPHTKNTKIFKDEDKAMERLHQSTIHELSKDELNSMNHSYHQQERS
jgi:hypothetical protein